MVIYYLGQTRSMLTRPRKIKKEESAWLFVKRRYDFPLGKDLFANSNTGEGWVRSSSISLYHTHRIHACCVPCVDPVEGSSFAGYESCFHVVQHFTKNVWNLEDGWWRTGRWVVKRQTCPSPQRGKIGQRSTLRASTRSLTTRTLAG